MRSETEKKNTYFLTQKNNIKNYNQTSLIEKLLPVVDQDSWNSWLMKKRQSMLQRNRYWYLESGLRDPGPTI